MSISLQEKHSNNNNSFRRKAELATEVPRARGVATLADEASNRRRAKPGPTGLPADTPRPVSGQEPPAGVKTAARTPGSPGFQIGAAGRHDQDSGPRMRPPTAATSVGDKSKHFCLKFSLLYGKAHAAITNKKNRSSLRAP